MINKAKKLQSEMIAWRRDIHMHPELGFEEKRTSALIAERMEEMGYRVKTGIGKTGVVAELGEGKPVVAIRADMDALPIQEANDVPYKSKHDGVMHACGHDAHMTNLIGVACYLAANQSLWKGTVMLIGQPAEERGAGARAMLEDDLFERFPKPDFAIALHVSPTLATGQIGYRPGYTMANVDSVDITLYGKGGHGAYPHTTIDPVVEAAQLVLALQTIVSREVDPLAPAVITVGSIHGGTKNNIIGDTVKLQLTVRSFSDETRQQLLSAIQHKAQAIASGAGAPVPLVEIAMGTPALFNDPALSARLRPAFQNQIGGENVVLSEQTMGGEDFSRYGKAGVPILMYWLGAVSQERLDEYKAAGEQPPSLHSHLFYPDINTTLVTGISTMSSAVLELLKP